MKRLIFVFLLVAGSAYAQSPADQISLGVGQAEVIPFDQPIGEVNFMPKETADAVPHSDRQISVVGIKAGVTQMFVFSPDHQLIYSATVAVAAESGHIVKLYGTGKNDDVNAGFIASYCDEFGCGRPDSDLPKPSVSVDRLRRGR